MELKKIQEFIAKNSIKPSDCIYHTSRGTKNSEKQLTGQIRVLVWKKDEKARCEYVCPECRHYAYVETDWKRPFYVKCEKCGFKISVPKMRAEAKKEAKAERGE